MSAAYVSTTITKDCSINCCSNYKLVVESHSKIFYSIYNILINIYNALATNVSVNLIYFVRIHIYLYFFKTKSDLLNASRVSRR